MEPPNPLASLDRPADRSTVHSLHDAGLLSVEARDEALRSLLPPRDWWTWSSRGLLYLGTALLLSGIVFFFAYNWTALGDFFKFGLIQVAIVGTAVGAWRAGLDRLGGKVLTLASAFLVGVLLAVYGQVYQTGADSWELFAGWAALILGWVAVSRFGALWLLWLVLLHVGFILYVDQIVGSDGWISPGAVALTLGLLDAAVLAGWEKAGGGARWFRRIVWGGTLAFLAFPLLVLIVDSDDHVVEGLTGAVALTGLIAGGYRYFRYHSPDLTALTLSGMAVSTVLLTLLGRGLFELTDAAGMFFIFGLCILGVVGAMVMVLWTIGRTMRSESRG